MKPVAIFVLAMVAVLGLVGAAEASSYTLTVGTTVSSYFGPATVDVSGQVSPAPGANTSVIVRVFNPTNALVVVVEATVNATTGSYGATFVAGGSQAWVDGDYVVNATWGAYGPVIFATASFVWALSSTTTSSSTIQTASTSSSVSTTSSQSESSNPSSSITSESSTITTTTTFTSSTPSTSSTSSTSTTSTAEVPAFPLQALSMILLTALVLMGYLLLRRGSMKRRDVSGAAI